MPTRGVFGFYLAGKFYVSFNMMDSYPRGLGNDIVEEILSTECIDLWRIKARSIKVVSSNIKPTEQDIVNLKSFTDLSVSDRSTSDWYCLLRKCQGSLKAILDSGYILNHVDEHGEVIWEDYGYILNFDQNTFDIYFNNKLFRSTPLTELYESTY